jgi:hypothetical protein
MLKGGGCVLRKVLEVHGLLCRAEKEKGVVIVGCGTLEITGTIIEDKTSPSFVELESYQEDELMYITSDKFE